MELEYYDLKSRAHPIRCMLHYYDLKFNDKKMSYDKDFKRWKLDDSGCPVQEDLDADYSAFTNFAFLARPSGSFFGNFEKSIFWPKISLQKPQK